MELFTNISVIVGTVASVITLVLFYNRLSKIIIINGGREGQIIITKSWILNHLSFGETASWKKYTEVNCSLLLMGNHIRRLNYHLQMMLM